MTRANRRGLRTLAQLVVSGGFTALVAALSAGLSPWQVGIVLACSQLAVTWGQNFLEGRELVPELLAPTAPAPETWVEARLRTDNQPRP